MQNIQQLDYITYITNKNKNNINKLPYLQNTSTNVMNLLLPFNEQPSPEIQSFLQSIKSPNICSVNLTSMVSRNDEVYVELYEDTSNLAKVSIARVVNLLRSLPSSYVHDIASNFACINNIPIEIVIDALDVKACEVSNIFDLINITESDKFREVNLKLLDHFESIKKDMYSFKCSRDELLTLTSGEFAEYLKTFTKQVQLCIPRDDIDVCVGYTNSDKILYPIFNIAGITDNFGRCLDTEISHKIPNILKYLAGRNINNYSKLTSSIMSYCLDEGAEITRDIICLVLNLLTKELMKKHEFLGGDMYNILVEQSLKRF